MRRTLLVVSLFAILWAHLAYAVSASAQSPEPREQSSGASSGSAAEQQQAKSYSLSPEKYEKAVAYSKTQYRLHFARIACTLLILLSVLSLRIAPIFRDWAERLSRRRFVQTIVFVPLLLLTIDTLVLPLDAYQHHIAVRYGLSVQNWTSWFWDWTKGELVQVVVASMLAYLLYGVYPS